jgi:hypothetical protein
MAKMEQVHPEFLKALKERIAALEAELAEVQRVSKLDYEEAERTARLNTQLEAELAASRAQSAQVAAALEHYAEKSNWTREARWTYETGRINAGGIEEESEAHVDLDTECVWNGEGDNGWEKADTALTAWRQGNK